MHEQSNLSVLDSQHTDAVKQALGRLLCSEVAETTYAEILDGLPTVDSFIEFHYVQTDHAGHPVFELDHTSLCPGIVERIRKFRRDFDPLKLSFPSTVRPSFLSSSQSAGCRAAGLPFS
jgi:hypothetical protein